MPPSSTSNIGRNVTLSDLQAMHLREKDVSRSNVIQNSPLKGQIKRFESAGLPFANPPKPNIEKQVEDYVPQNLFSNGLYENQTPVVMPDAQKA